MKTQDKRYNSPLVYDQARAIKILKNCRKLQAKWKAKADDDENEIDISEAQDMEDSELGIAMAYARFKGIADWIELELLLSNKKTKKKVKP